MRPVLLTALLAVSSLACATDVPTPTTLKPITVFQVRGKDVTVYHVKDVTVGDRSEEDLVASVAPIMREYSKNTEHETCTQICKTTDGVYGASILTIESHIACPITNACPEGMDPTNVDVHSHIHVSRYLPNPVDRLFLIQRYDLRQKASTDPEEFSEKDTNSTKAYLVTPTKVRMFTGR